MKTIRIDIPDQDGWVEVVDPGDLSQRKFDEWAATADHLNEEGKTEQFLRGAISAWHLVDPDTGQAMNDPQTDDLKGLKVSTVKAITGKVVEAVKASVFRST